MVDLDRLAERRTGRLEGRAVVGRVLDRPQVPLRGSRGGRSPFPSGMTSSTRGFAVPSCADATTLVTPSG